MSVELCCIERLCPGSAAGFRRKRLCVLFRIRLVRFHWANRILRAVHGARHVRPRRAQHRHPRRCYHRRFRRKKHRWQHDRTLLLQDRPGSRSKSKHRGAHRSVLRKGGRRLSIRMVGQHHLRRLHRHRHRHQAAHDAALPRYSRRPRLPECLDRRRRTHGFEGEREHRPVSPGLRSAGRLSHRAGHQAHRGAVRLSAAVRGLRLRRRQACPGPGAQSPAHRGVRRFHFRRLRQRGDRPRAFAWRRKTPP